LWVDGRAGEYLSMAVSVETNQALEVHDVEALAKARSALEACNQARDMERLVLEAVQRNREWRGTQCINLLAPEAPTSPTVRALLSAEVGTRAAEGHIGKINRWFAGTKYIDEIEALCVELLKKAFRARYADHRLVAGMVGNLAVYAACCRPGDVIMSIPQPFGGHSSNLPQGPAGVRGLRIVEIPYNPEDLVVDLDLFRKVAPLVRPKVVALGASMTLFPFPLRAMQEIVADWGGKIYFDGAHQLGLIAGGEFQDPLHEGAAVMTGSAGKTFSGPQGGIIVWDDPELTVPLTEAIFPVLAATHQVNRVAALAVSAAEMIAFGKAYMQQIVRNAQALGAALGRRGIPMLGAHKNYTATHQVIANVRKFGGGLETAQKLERANIITNKNLIPGDRPEDWDRPSGLRIGTTEVTRLGMDEKDMDVIADFMARVLVEKANPETVGKQALEFRQAHQTLYYTFDTGVPPQ
jgi:glycine hydroxymethyltransferase